MDKRITYLDELFGELSYQQLIVAYMMFFENEKDDEIRKEVEKFVKDCEEKLQHRGKTIIQIKKGLEYLKEIARERMS